MMAFYRTDDARFEALADYPFAAHYVDIEGLRMHYVDEGEPSAAPVLMLHGEPSWSYLYRHMIPICAGAGQRVIAPDLIGFGKSDKPLERADYSYQRHVDWMKAFLRALDLRNITLFCQDWGSLIGLRVAAEESDRFDRIVVANGGLPGAGSAVRPPLVNTLAFLAWRTFATYSPWFPISAIVNFGCLKTLSDAERRAYDAPFPESAASAGARVFPSLVPIRASDPANRANRGAWEVLRGWTKPFLTLFADADPITRGFDRFFQEHVPGAKGQPHARLHAGHFIQEDVGPELAKRIVDLISATAHER